MDFCKHFPLAIIVILAILAVYGVSGVVRNAVEISNMEFKSAAWPLDTRPINLVFMLTQPLLALGALIGIIGTLKKDAVMIYCTAFILLGVFVPYLLFGVFAVKESAAITWNNALSHALFKTVRNGTVYHQWLIDFQYENQCCGVYSYMDWNKMFNVSSSGLALPPNSVPDTCCSPRIRIPPPDCGVNILHENQSVEAITAVLFTDGCGSKLSQIYSQRLLEHGIEMIVVGFICLLISVLIYFGIAKNYTLVAFGNNNGNERGNLRLVANNDPAYLARNRSMGLGVRRAADAGDCGMAIESLDFNGNPGSRRASQQRRPSRGPVKKFGPSSKQRRLNNQALQAQGQTQAPDLRLPNPQPVKVNQEEDGCISAIQTEMLFHQASDKYSIQSTCPYSSTSQNLWFKKGPSGNTDPHSNKPSIANPSTVNTSGGAGKEKDKGHGTQLTYYSSLPQVQIKTPPGSHHHQLRSWVSKPLKGFPDAGAGAAGTAFSLSPPLVPNAEIRESNNNTAAPEGVGLDLAACDTPETGLPPITVGVNNGNLLIMESHEKLITTTPTDSDYLEEDIGETERVAITENFASLLEEVEVESKLNANLDVIVEEEGTGLESSTEVAAKCENENTESSGSESFRSSPVVTFDEVVQARIEYLDLDTHCGSSSDTESSPAVPEEVRLMDA